MAKGCSSLSDDGLENIIVEAMQDQMGARVVLADDGGSRFSAYSPLRVYCGRLMMPCERRSMEPLAAVTARVARPASIALLGFVGRAVGQTSGY